MGVRVPRVTTPAAQPQSLWCRRLPWAMVMVFWCDQMLLTSRALKRCCMQKMQTSGGGGGGAPEVAGLDGGHDSDGGDPLGGRCDGLRRAETVNLRPLSPLSLI